jgi:hypothetical protein
MAATEKKTLSGVMSKLAKDPRLEEHYAVLCGIAN